MGNLFSSGGISEDDCGILTDNGDDYTHMKWDGTSCVHKANSCGSSEWYNMTSKNCESNLVDSSTIVAAECEESSCPPSLNKKTMLLDKDFLTKINSECAGDYWDNSKATHQEACITCGENQILGPSKTDCICPSDDYTMNSDGNDCTLKCDFTKGKIQSGDKCVCANSNGWFASQTVMTNGFEMLTCEYDAVKAAAAAATAAAPVATTAAAPVATTGDVAAAGDVATFTNPVTGKKMTDKEKLMLLVLVLVILYMYNPKFKAFVNRSTRHVVRRRR